MALNSLFLDMMRMEESVGEQPDYALFGGSNRLMFITHRTI